MTDKYSYYLEDDNTVKDMDHFQAMQMSESSFNESDLEGLKSQWKKLATEFHPDKNEGSNRAKITFQRIQQAYETLSDPSKRQQYLLDKKVDFVFDVHFVYSDLNVLLEVLKIKGSVLDKLFLRLDRLNNPRPSLNSKDSIPLEVRDSLEQIALDFSKIYQGTMITLEIGEKQFKLISEIAKQAKNGGEFYALNLIVRGDPILSQTRFVYIQQAAAKGHLLGLMHMTSGVFAGYFRPLEDSIKWGLNSLRYIEEIAVPKLEKEEPNSETLKEIKEVLAFLRERRNEVLPLTIPREPQAFNKLVTQVVEYRHKRGGISIDDFKLDPDMFETLEMNPTLSLTSVGSEVDKEHELLLKIHRKFAQKVVDLQNTPEHNKNVLRVAKELNTQLAHAISTYKDNKANSAMKKEEATTRFLETCAAAINNAKPLLEKELGWGDFLTNLLKSFANAVISAANAVVKAFGSQSQFTLFTPTKAPFIAEVEEVESELHEQLSPK